MDGITKIIVKVGKKSQVKFSHSKVYRAITYDDLVKTHKKYNDCNIVVIESIDKDEQTAIKEFIVDFRKQDRKNTVLFFIPNDDEVTSGIADELDYNIYLTLSDLYRTIYDTFSINVSTLLEDKRRINSEAVQDTMPEGITDIFGDISADASNAIQDDINSFDEGKIQEVKQEEPEEISEEQQKEIIEQEIEKESQELQKNIQKQQEQEQEKESEEQKKTKKAEKVTLDKAETPQEKTKTSESKKEASSKKESDTTIIDSASQDMIDNLKTQLRDAKYDYSVLLKDMKSANTRILDLEKIINVIKDEKEAILDKFNGINENSVLEDPISLTEYKALQTNIEDCNRTIKELQSTVESLRDTIEEKEGTILDRDQTISDMQTSLNETKLSLDSINESIESGEIHKDIVAEYEKKLNDMLVAKDNMQAQMDAMAEEANSLNSLVSDTSYRADQEAEARLEVLDLLVAAIDKIGELSKTINDFNKVKAQLNTKINNLTEKDKNNSGIIKEQSEKIHTLEDSLEETSKRLELSSNYAESEKSQLSNSISELSAQLDVATEQLKQKEEQYNKLVAASGMDEHGASALLETNKTLETTTRTLREQLSAAKMEVDKLKKANAESTSIANSYKSQNKQLNDTINILTQAGAQGGAGAIAGVNAGTLLKPIKYQGQARIVPVFGSGSFGITTTAMSLAYKLCATSKVLYMDFDMVTPKADAWFSKLPLCQNVPGVNSNDRRMTALGIFYEIGLQTFVTYADNILKDCEKTKGGGLDYLSGVYYRVDSMKILTSDYTTLFNFLGSRYQYIVVDLGKLGCSDIGDQLIKVITDISVNNVAVTTYDRFEVRNFKAKLVENKINMNNMAWLLNMCETTTVDDKIKQILAPSNYGLLLKDMSIYGTRQKFTRNNVNKDKLELFINSAVFGKRK